MVRSLNTRPQAEHRLEIRVECRSSTLKEFEMFEKLYGNNGLFLFFIQIFSRKSIIRHTVAPRHQHHQDEALPSHCLEKCQYAYLCKRPIKRHIFDASRLVKVCFMTIVQYASQHVFVSLLCSRKSTLALRLFASYIRSVTMLTLALT